VSVSGITWLEIGIILILLALNAYFSAARAALANVRKARLRQLADEGKRTARVAEQLAEDASQMLATTRLGAGLSTFLVAALAAYAFAPALGDLLRQVSWLARVADGLALVLTAVVAALVTLIISELVPESIAIQHSERVSMWLARPLRLITLLLAPPARMVVGASNVLTSLLGAEPRRELPMVTEEEIKTLVDAGEEEGIIQEDEKEMIYSIFELGDTLVREVMVPRIDVVALEVETPMLEALDRIMDAGHSRIPVYADSVDDIVGVLYAKDLLPPLREGDTSQAIRSLLRPAYFVPETKKADELLPDLQQRRVHMAIIVDEYGGTAGLVTIEDLLEEIVGEIQDEYDTEEPFFVQLDENEYVCDARIDLDDLNRLADAELPTEDSDTLGGFIYAALGRVPSVGNQVHHHDLTFTVESVVGRRIKKVRVERHPLPEIEAQRAEVPVPVLSESNGRV
jgi:putative hemolysin